MKKLFIIALSFFMFACSEEEDSCTPTPTLITNEPSAITDTAVTFSGTIEAPTCDPTVTSQGFVYSFNTLPKITDEFIEVNGKAISKEITGLQQNRTYYYRTYFTNPTGTYYGKEIMFKTEVGAALLNLSSVINIKAFSADVSSNIVSSGGGDIIARGVCWSENPNPTIIDSKTEDGLGVGSFTSNLQGLTENTTYYVRAYATNETGTTYGEQVSFTTQNGIVSFTTTSISNITINSAISGGNIIDDGGAAITARGVCWSTSPNPTTADNKTETGAGIGSFTVNLTGLADNTTYYFRAFAVNEVDVFYSEELLFNTDVLIGTEGTLIDFDGNIYVTKKMCDGKIWILENLNVSHYANGDEIPQISIWNQWNTKTGAWCYENNDDSESKLYNWHAVNDSRGLAPDGWHIASVNEWNNLINCSGGISNMMTENKWFNNSGITNSSGFSINPGVTRSINGGFRSTYGTQIAFWCKDKNSRYDCCAYSIGVISNANSNYIIERDTYNKENGHPVRIVKN